MGRICKNPASPAGGNGVCGVIRIRPRVSAIGKPTVREVVYDSLERVLFRAHKNET